VANTKSAAKRMRQSERRRLRNRALRSKLRSAVKTARTSAGQQGVDATAAVAEAIRALDKAVTKGVIHRNTAARKKSGLAIRLGGPERAPQAPRRSGHPGGPGAPLGNA
jgi:small subunit ribosomal protein S20